MRAHQARCAGSPHSNHDSLWARLKKVLAPRGVPYAFFSFVPVDLTLVFHPALRLLSQSLDIVCHTTSRQDGAAQFREGTTT